MRLSACCPGYKPRPQLGGTAALSSRRMTASVILLYGDCACFSDKIGCSGGGRVVKELLSCVGELYAVLGDKHERTLDSVAAVKHGRLGALNACHLDSLYTALTVYCGERGVAYRVLVVLYCGDDRAGGGELLSELALVARLCYRLKAVSCARAGLAADAGDREVVAADLIPVGDLTGKMPAICSTVRSSTLLSLLTMMAIPSSATVVAVSPDSLSLSFLDESPISVLPFLTASMPVPEPVGSYVTVMPPFSFMNCSLSVLMTFCIEVEPFVETVPLTCVSEAAVVCAAPEPVVVSLAPPPAVLPQLASAVTLIRAVSAIAMIFFMLLLFIFIISSFLPWYGSIIVRRCKGRYPAIVKSRQSRHIKSRRCEDTIKQTMLA